MKQHIITGLSNWEDCGEEDIQKEMKQHYVIGKCLEMER